MAACNTLARSSTIPQFSGPFIPRPALTTTSASVKGTSPLALLLLVYPLNAWRDAPLFVLRPNDSTTTAALPSGDTRATVPVGASVGAEPQAGSMFVAHAGDGATP